MEEDYLRELRALREEMARLTLEIIRLSGERISISRRIGEIKARNKMPIEDPDVERDLRGRVIDLSERHGIDVNFSLRLLDLLIEESKRVQREIVKSSIRGK
ncbi:MAG: chorismate mutase [Candidatus Bathyarchaeia archaeon]